MAAVIALSLLGDGCHAEQQHWPLWESYSKAFIDGQGRVIDHTSADRTTSEAQAYAMFFALVAGDQTHFKQLLNWTAENLAQGDLLQHLPAWSWGKAPDGSWHVLDPNPASDADLWMAYDLLEAGRLWSDDDYKKLGTAMIEHIEQQEVVMMPPSTGCADGPLLLPAPTGFHPDDLTWVFNPSYIPLPLVQYFAKTRHGVWSSMLDELPRFYNHTATAGWAPDWSKCIAGQGWFPSAAPGQQPMQSQAGQPGVNPAAATPQTANPIPNAVPATAQTALATPAPPPAPAYASFDAIRVYLWLGIANPKTPGLDDALSNFPAMGAYLSKPGVSVPPLTVDSFGSIKNTQGPLSFSAAVIPYLQALGLGAQARAQKDRLASGLNAGTGLYGNPAQYYDQNIALFATGWLEKRYCIEENGQLKLKCK
ncbi:MAG TPA: glycosyl hydrolase family 8 [Acidobacteriaceae bacterium]|nr:glycosyl hydrolase family 8 [Acidobacteriaceae bacterium]